MRRQESVAVLYLERGGEMVWDLRLREAVLEVTLRGGTPLLLTGLMTGGVQGKRRVITFLCLAGRSRCCFLRRQV